MIAEEVSQFGVIRRAPLSRIRKLSGAHVTKSWQAIPHVTNFHEADVTELEEFRKVINGEQQVVKLTMLAFLMKAAAATLKRFPSFNASLDGDDLILKRYVHLGFATDTPNGLVVPVIRDVDQKGLLQIAEEIAALSDSARRGKLASAALQGGCFSISSLGSISGCGFTPIINSPELAILGAARARIQPSWDGQQFKPRLTIPLSLSWDHRALDGLAAARFLSHLADCLRDMLLVAI